MPDHTTVCVHRGQLGVTPACIREAGWIRGIHRSSGADIWELVAALQGQEKPLSPRRGAPGPLLHPRLCQTPCRPASPSEITPCSGRPSEGRDKGPRTGPCTTRCAGQSDAPFAPPAQAAHAGCLPATHEPARTQHPTPRQFWDCRVSPRLDGILEITSSSPWLGALSTSGDAAPIAGAATVEGSKKGRKQTQGPNHHGGGLRLLPSDSRSSPPAAPSCSGLCSQPRSTAPMHPTASPSTTPHLPSSAAEEASACWVTPAHIIRGPLPGNWPHRPQPWVLPRVKLRSVPLVFSVLAQKPAPFSSKPALPAAADAGLEEEFCRVLSHRCLRQKPLKSHGNAK